MSATTNPPVTFYGFTPERGQLSYNVHGDYGLRMGNIVWVKEARIWKFLAFNHMAFTFNQLEAIAEFMNQLPVPA